MRNIILPVLLLFFHLPLKAFELPHCLEKIRKAQNLEPLSTCRNWNTQSIVSELKKEEAFFQKWDEVYQLIQELCLFNEDQKNETYCEETLNRMLTINESSFEQKRDPLNNLTSQIQEIEQFLQAGSAPILGEKMTTPDTALWDKAKDSDQAPLFTQEIDLDKLVECLFLIHSDRKKLMTALNTLAPYLEKVMTSIDIELSIRVQAYCALVQYYELKGGHDRLITFVYLNAPESQDLFCQ